MAFPLPEFGNIYCFWRIVSDFSFVFPLTFKVKFVVGRKGGRGGGVQTKTPLFPREVRLELPRSYGNLLRDVRVG